jgi:acyl-CoA:6-aminopenicillanic acid acyl transferase
LTATITERQWSGLPWLTVTGPREAAFRALGQFAHGEIRAVLGQLPESAPLQRYAARPGGRAALAAGLQAARASHPRELAELSALADGAQLNLETLLLANLRADLGGGDGTGCSDLGWRRERSYVAHNEDAAPALHGRLTVLTLTIDGDAPVTTQWYPGFLPSNTFAITGHGLVCAVTHIPEPAPAPAAGRHFVARALQQSPSLDAAITHLRTHPAAGGFGYTIGEFPTGRVVSVEAIAGRVNATEAYAATQPLLWHTNHARRLTPRTVDVRKTSTAAADPRAQAARSLGSLDESLARGRVLDALEPPVDEPDVGWFLRILTGAPGVYRNADDDPLMTLCTTVADLSAGEVTLQARDRAPTTLTLRDLTR